MLIGTKLSTLIIFVVLFCGCSSNKSPTYAPASFAIDKALILIGEHRDLIRAEFGAPYCRNGGSWYYFDGNAPNGTVAEIRFRDDHVFSYLEQGYDEHNYMTWIPLLIESLKDEDIDTRQQGYNYLRFLIEAFEDSSAQEHQEDRNPVPLETTDYEKWRRWWLDTGRKSDKYPAFSPMDKYLPSAYSPTDRALKLVGEHRDTVRVEFGVPHCRDGGTWYYFDGNAPSGTVAGVQFKNDYVFRYLEQEYDERNCVIWMPLLMESLRDEDIYIRHRGYKFLRFWVEDNEYRSAVPRVEDWNKIPFESNDYEKWQHWWTEIGEKSYSRER